MPNSGFRNFFYEYVQLVQKLKKDFEFSRQKQLLATFEGKRRKIWKCICRKFEIRASLPFATGIRDFPRREQVGK